jgi:hypothetical protein
MAYANGTIPTSQLLVLSVRSRTLGPQYAPPLVARAFEAANIAFKQAFGKELEPVEAYRWLARQWILYNGWIKRLPGYNLAAYPGTSKHGAAGAIDFGSGVNVIGSAEHQWMVANGPRWGFIWTGKNFRPVEGWHFDHNGTVVAALNTTTFTATAGEDEMPLPRVIYTVTNAFAVLEPGSEPYLIPETQEGLERVSIILGHNNDAIFRQSIPSGVVRVASVKNWEVEVREARYRAAENRKLLASAIIAASK